MTNSEYRHHGLIWLFVLLGLRADPAPPEPAAARPAERTPTPR